MLSSVKRLEAVCIWRYIKITIIIIIIIIIKQGYKISLNVALR